MRFANWRSRLERRFSRRCLQVHLGHRTLYILPTGFGVLWLLAAAALYLLGTQAQRNTPVLLGFLMLSLEALALFLTHSNLQGLELKALDQEPCCAGDAHTYWLEVRSRIWRPGVRWRWLTQQPPNCGVLHIQPGQSRIGLPWSAQQRGIQPAGRLLLISSAPLGLFRCWAYWEPSLPVWVAPRRLKGPITLHSDEPPHSDGDVLDGLAPWRPEQGWRRVDWKAKARGRGWRTKTFLAPPAEQLWLAPAPQLPLETALEHLCDGVYRKLKAGEAVGLALPGGQGLPPLTGRDQLQACLRALAAWPPCP